MASPPNERAAPSGSCRSGGGKLGIISSQASQSYQRAAGATNENIFDPAAGAGAYITVRQTGPYWRVELLKPCEGRGPIRSVLATAPDLAVAISCARDAAEGLGKPLRLPEGHE